MATRTELLKAREELHVAVRASEEWADGYLTDPEAFNALLVAEASLESDVAEFFHEQADRVLKFISWQDAKLKADVNGVPPNSDEVWTEEEKAFFAAIFDTMLILVAIGWIHEARKIGIPTQMDFVDRGVNFIRDNKVEVITQIGNSPYFEKIMESTRRITLDETGRMIDVTRKRIREAMATSVAAGENVEQATARILKIVDNPARANMIAQTESVNMFNAGQAGFASVNGGKTKTWHCDFRSEVCQICLPLNGLTISVLELFHLEDGRTLLGPTAHPHCKCYIEFFYGQRLSNESLDNN